ncbi:hypothetical protein VTK73DRAFT_313 [Phialemonium thermophilum]|uniref:Protein kinase domain-containing protein n=1 Tax=Phialemonium thermophilum TaxID=223376 RepID=A0ABR3VVU2_9PEZI
MTPQMFSLKTILLLADQALPPPVRPLQGFVHCDIKPGDFVMGTGRWGNFLYTIDFGLATRLCCGSRPYEDALGHPIGGTLNYATTDNHKGLDVPAALFLATPRPSRPTSTSSQS